ncbi:unnamed protein product [Musa acuminata subsp. malaccensis]|uniref:(wild Malaysian banana) hypothetical protein n=1 Tax=Musa acuminata subsp. malaccensis TaxID=214687 RepID=A0A804L3L5_MUSAM|nr:PREDICTED: uncharacterized protein PAM68-like [Musa acuminata subsp. malaccensis]CAG1863380.1 unnamed protein product [Musa acuminata subsp. malaccensis]
METLLHQVGLPSPPLAERAFPWIRSSSNLVHHTNLLHALRSSKRRAARLQAQGRGFGVSVSDRKARPEEDDGVYRSEDGDDEIPQVVFDRMIRRIVFSVGAPMASGIGVLYLESFLKKSQLWEVPGWLPLLTILLSFGTSALGIAYGTLSTSWDPNKEGSLLGWEQARKNWPELWKDEEDESK